ncbi:Superfamily II DNA or RNA helicase [Pseudidiomarina planktonica]|uniref:Superfamily II DNA or RNA helicase n=1 Tax=Pseudidiomarina planktonica TaxID=1323738 RepID=A0A1Y6FYA1_9GAMM|nr:DUF3427 domain-containing protein [Pseudidiomarina planktonica]RUO63952.1 DUF3427 domain-containing protein [Pseudidiomarina planktonica]SMQ79962.1 Superfamily II DNA or RNA helicase [Pseudidiomarina planktonica]
MPPLKEGLYELIKTSSLATELEESELVAITERLTEAADVRHLSQAFTEQITQILDELGERGGTREQRLKNQVRFVNDLLTATRQQAQINHEHDAYLEPPEVLRALHLPNQPIEIPEIGLAQPWLFTAGKDSPALLNELQKELSSCNHVEILVSFITVAGVRKIIDTLRQITAVNAEGVARTSLRIITTTYTGATDQKAVKMLAELPNCRVKVSLDGRRTRLHAKAWIFERDSGFGSAYVGSANLSGAALMGGLEWTVKFTERGQNLLYQRAKAHFETLWQDDEFQQYDPHNEDHVKSLRSALARESGGNGNVVGITTFFDIQPKPFQRDILEQLENERAHQRFRNLLVAATGTGKTVMAAFDYKRICQQEGGRPRLLFVAHRQEILKQSLLTYRHVLRDNNFGDLLTGNTHPSNFEHLFSTIQSVGRIIDEFGEDYWRVIVIDECHHIGATTFTDLVERVQPKYLLGLTATPERSDGRSILQHFDSRPDGSPAVQMRLWNALDLQLLAPFEYFACTDDTNFEEVNWRQPGEIAQLDQILSGNDARARSIIRAWQELVSDIGDCRALAFCVTVKHASFMVDQFNKVGIKAAMITGQSSQAERERLPQLLERKEINVLLTVDLFNEGVDLPFVDTLLLLRPTQSSTLFQQQIGRGLRLHEGKDSCLILDFVGQHAQGFRFDVLYGAITGLTRKEILAGVEDGFGRLPSGCHLQLQKQARENILNSLKTAVNYNWQNLTRELRQYQMLQGTDDISLTNFVQEQALELSDIYRYSTGAGQSGWTTLKRSANLVNEVATPEEKYFSRRLAALTHIDDTDYLKVIREVGESNGALEVTEANHSYILMLAYQLAGGQGTPFTVPEFLSRLQQNSLICQELVELTTYLDAKTNHVFTAVPGLENTTLKLHSAYQTREILTAVRYYTEEFHPPHRYGVLRLTEEKTELMFVTLDKSEALHEGVAYDDYAISQELFHWQSQNTAAPHTQAGQRYLNKGSDGWTFQLFVRRNKNSAYRACGPVEFHSFHGEKPMNITWRLKSPLPARLFDAYSVMRAS